MADQERPIEEQINEARGRVFSALRDPNATAQQKRGLAEELSKLCSRQIVQRQQATEPKPFFLKEARK